MNYYAWKIVHCALCSVVPKRYHNGMDDEIFLCLTVRVMMTSFGPWFPICHTTLDTLWGTVYILGQYSRDKKERHKMTIWTSFDKIWIVCMCVVVSSKQISKQFGIYTTPILI